MNNRNRTIVVMGAIILVCMSIAIFLGRNYSEQHLIANHAKWITIPQNISSLTEKQDLNESQLPSYVHVNPDTPKECAAGMVLVDGIYCPYVGHRCLEFINEKKDVCREFSRDILCEGYLEHRRFCIDKYEYPNIEGAIPAIMVDYNEAVTACALEGKRLCTTQEWEFACEGPDMWPYPYGFVRDKNRCNIDRHYYFPDLNAFSDPWKISEEVFRLDQRVHSGERKQCVSPFGVYDMTGNVDEWVDNLSGGRKEKPFRSALKGGYFGPIRARCRPMTSSHNEWFRFYQVGFRCCANAKTGKPKVTIPRKKSTTQAFHRAATAQSTDSAHTNP